MYSPYLCGRRSELLALRNLKSENVDFEKFVPVVEPVLENTGDLLRFIDTYGKAGIRTVIIMNPHRHQYKGGSGVASNLRKDLAESFAKYTNLMPGFIWDAKTNVAQASAFQKIYSDKQVAFLLDSPVISDADLKSIAHSPETAFVFSLSSSVGNTQLALIPKTKLVSIRDGFKKLPRNADYNGVEFFSDQHQLIGKEFAGIGDYTITGKALEIGGGKPGAVAIHASFRPNGKDEAWIEHFVSDEIDRDIGDAASKFLEAAKKLVRAAKKRPAEFATNTALDAYRKHVAEDTFPGLGKNKEYQIRHHIVQILALL